MKTLLKAVALLMMAGSAAAAPAAQTGAPTVTITDAWFRALPGQLPAGGYFTARNTGTRDLAITGAKSNGCGLLMLHESQNMGGMSSMNMARSVPLPAGGSVAFAPGGYHLMCEQPKLKIGTPVSVVLSLSDGTSVAVRFAVRNAKGK